MHQDLSVASVVPVGTILSEEGNPGKLPSVQQVSHPATAAGRVGVGGASVTATGVVALVGSVEVLGRGWRGVRGLEEGGSSVSGLRLGMKGVCVLLSTMLKEALARLMGQLSAAW